MKKEFLFSFLFFLSYLTHIFAQGAWNRKADFSGSARDGAFCFVIGNKAYLGTGRNGITNYSDFWEWDQVTNIWTQKANFGAQWRNNAIGFSIGAKGYAGGGNYSGFSNDFWEWDQVTNIWTKKANFEGGIRSAAVAFSIGTKGYIGTGSDGSSLKNDFWEWDQSSDTWKQKTDFVGQKRIGAIGFSIGTFGYIGTGVYGNTDYKDLWEWNSDCNVSVLGNINTICAGTNISLLASYSPSSFNMIYNWFPAEGLNSTSIANPVASPTVTTTYQVVAQDPTLQCTGTAYYTVTVNHAFSVGVISTNNLICFGTNTSLTAVVTPYNSNLIYNWSPSVGLNSTTTSNPIAAPTATTIYNVNVQDPVTQCTENTKYTIGVLPLPVITINGADSLYVGQTGSLCASGGVKYLWSTGQTTSCILIQPTASTTYTVNVWDVYGCHASRASYIKMLNPVSSYCSNTDFEEGNFMGWTGMTGWNISQVNPPTIISWTGGINNQGNNLPATSPAQQTLLSSNLIDPLTIDSVTNQPDIFMTMVAQNNGNYSVRLGNSQAYAGAEGLRFFFRPTFQDSIFTYQFACVFQNAGHPPYKNPGFMVNVFDAANMVIPSLCDTIHALDPNYQFFHVAPSAPDPTVIYKRWSIATINLSAYIGQIVRIEFANFDCSETAHWGYTYLDIPCTLLTGIVHSRDNNEVSVYPNPADDVMYISCPLNAQDIFITDVTGRRFFISMNKLENKINLSSFPSGVYFLNVKIQDRVVVKKIIKK